MVERRTQMALRFSLAYFRATPISTAVFSILESNGDVTRGVLNGPTKLRDMWCDAHVGMLMERGGLL